LVYIAGPYRSSVGRSVLENVREAERAAIALARVGIHYICPHLNTAFMSGCGDHAGVAASRFFLDMDENIVRRCDAVWRLPGDSSGADGEVRLARKLGKPVFYSMRELVKHYRRRAGTGCPAGRT
jgi:hypothetical protein